MERHHNSRNVTVAQKLGGQVVGTWAPHWVIKDPRTYSRVKTYRRTEDDLAKSRLSQTKLGGFARAVDWVGVLLAYFLGRVIDSITRFVSTRLRTSNLGKLKRGILTGLGVTFAIWIVVCFGTLLMGSWVMFRQPGFLTVGGVATYAGFFIVVNLTLLAPLLALRYVSRRWDPSHWAFKMTNDIWTKGDKKREAVILGMGYKS